MSNRVLWFRGAPGRRLLLALLLSLLLHAWLVGGLDGWLPHDDSPDAIPIRVELAPPPAPPLQTVQPRPAPKAPPVSRKPALPKPVATPAQPAPEAPAPPPAAAAAEPPPPAPVAEAEPAVPDVAEPAAEEITAASPQAEEAIPSPPRHVEIDYQILRKGGVAAVERHRYQAGENGDYVLTSVAEAKGLLALALADLVQRSEGVITARGLQPSRYLYQYGKNADKAQKAGFDWQARTLSMETGSRRQTVELPEGTQDLMSFMYQFMFSPPLQEMQLAVTNGKKLKVYNYGFEGEETLETRMGPLRTWHIGKSGSDGEEKTEIWLAADYHYLPVKIRKTETDGTVTERIASRLQME